MNKIKLIVSISIIIFLSGCVNEQSKENVPVSMPSVTTVPSVSTVPSVPTITTKIPVIIYNDNNDLASNIAKEYTYIDFFSNTKPTSDNILINVDITAKLGTMIEIKDKKDMGCLDVINKNRGTEMSSSRYQYYLKCSEPMDVKSAIVSIKNPDQAISYMIKIETTEI